MTPRATARARFRVPLRHAVIASLISVVPFTGPASAATAPATPGFIQAWGALGSASGQFNAPAAVATDPVGNVFVVDTNNHRVQKFDFQGHFLLSWGGFGSGPSKFNAPSAISVDASSNVCVADPGNVRIKVFTSDGILEHQWGSAGVGSGQFTVPFGGVATDASGNVYVSDASNRIQKFTAGGTFLLEWGTAGTGNGQFNSPAGIAVDAKGNVYVADQLNHRIQEFSATGTYLAQWGVNGSGAGQLSQPHGIAVDALGNLYVSEIGNERIQKFAGDGTSLTTWGSLGSFAGQFDAPSGVASDAAGNLYVADTNNHRVQKFSGAGTALVYATPVFQSNLGSAGSGNGQLNTPYAVATDAAGWVYVADTFNSRVQKFSGAGVYSLKFGGPGTLPGQFANLNAIATDATGNIFVVSSDNRVEKFSSTGSFLLQWGSAGAAAGQFNFPFGMAVDASGFVYVVDGGNDRVQKFTNAGSFVTQWGTTGSGAGQFNAPRGIAADRAGNVYVTDGNARIQKFTSAGTYLTQWAIANSPASSVTNAAVDALGDVYVANGGPGSNLQKFRSDGSLVAQWGSYGSGNGQFAPPYGLAVDPTGNVYVCDYGGSRIVKFAAPPAVLLVSDVGNDQGRQTRLRIRGASLDAPNNGGVTGYAVYRQVEPLPVAASLSWRGPSGDHIVPGGLELAGWDYVGTQPAGGDPEYSMVVPTLADANASSTYYSAFMVRALTADPLTHYDSPAEYGYSIDNLSPPAPTPFTAAYAASATNLHWGVSGASDFATFRLYKGSAAGFALAPGSLVTATTDTGYVDVGAAGSYYKLTAVDRNGNESAFALVGPAQTTSVGPGPAVAFALEGARPNPARGLTLAVAFSLPTAQPANLELLDVMGRVVARRAVGSLGVGRHVLNLSDGRAIAPGLYQVRLSQGGDARVRRVVVIE